MFAGSEQPSRDVGGRCKTGVMSILSELSERVPGRAHGPGTTEYDAGAAVFAGVGEPEVVVRPRTAAEVAAAVGLAAASGMPIAVRSGGHGIMPVDDGLVIDLAEFTSVDVGDDGLVTVGGGAHWGDVAAALAPHGLAISSGDTRDVGVGGLALGGGIGWLVRQHGLTIDCAPRGRARHRRRARCSRSMPSSTPTCSGRSAAAAATSASSPGSCSRRCRRRPGRAATCTSTRPTCRPCCAPGATSCARGPTGSTPRCIVHAAVRARDARRPAARRRPAGHRQRLRELLEPLLSLPSVTEVTLGAVAYGDLLEDAPPGRPPFLFVGGNGFVPELSDEALEAIAAASTARCRRWSCSGRSAASSAGSRPTRRRSPTATPRRCSSSTGCCRADATPSRSRRRRRGSDAALAFTSGTYGNFAVERGDAVIASMYPPATLERLRRMKAELDPGNVFRQNHNITPAG